MLGVLTESKKAHLNTSSAVSFPFSFIFQLFFLEPGIRYPDGHGLRRLTSTSY